MLRTGCGGLLIGLMLLLLSGCQQTTDGQSLQIELTPAQLGWLGDQVFRNECAGSDACLVHWNEGEAFPSLGIGHFIWYPKEVDGRFVESFPEMIDHLSKQGVKLPQWLAGLEPFDAPWASREAFLLQSDTAHVRELRHFLSVTRGEQAGFLLQRAQKALGRVVAAAPQADRKALTERVRTLLGTPGGVYAVIDYVNFKGEGLVASERYHGRGWGLLQVLQGMDNNKARPALERFRESAMQVLTQRADNAANPIEKERWLGGWLNRLATYREPK